MKKIFLIFLVSSIFLGSFSSCVSQKELTYLQNKSTAQLDSLGYYQQTRDDYQIQVNDILNINIRTFDEKSSRIYNAFVETGTAQVNDAIIYIKGNSVDNEGFVDLPVLGRVNVEGLTLYEVKQHIENKLHESLKENAVYLKVQLAGIRFSIVGEVNRPGKYVIYQNQANIFEAIATAGDINMVGMRDKVQVIRQTPDGVKLSEIDLTDSNVLNSPYYFIQPNDVINVKPLKAKSWGVGTEGFKTLVSIVTLISSTLLIIVNVNNL